MKKEAQDDHTVEVEVEDESEGIHLDDYFDGSTIGDDRAAFSSEFQPFVGECVDERHPHIVGRYLIEWSERSGESHSQWLPKISHITVREGDRVLVQSISNAVEPIIVGVVDSLQPRKPEKRERSTIELKADECISVVKENGEEFLRITSEEGGPVIQFVKEDIELSTDGRLKIDARSIEMNARLGGVRISATDDVEIDGEMINLN